MSIRLAILAHHYRSDWEWTDDELTRAQARLESWRTAAAGATSEQAVQLTHAVRAALADDLDAPTALAALDAWAAEPPGDGAGAAAVRDLVDALLGVRL